MPLQQASAIREQQKHDEANRESQKEKSDRYIKDISQLLLERFEHDYPHGEKHKRQDVEVEVNASDGHVVADIHLEGVSILNQIQHQLKTNGWALEHLQLGFGCINSKWNLSWLVY
jgi:hypothetical protein